MTEPFITLNSYPVPNFAFREYGEALCLSREGGKDRNSWFLQAGIFSYRELHILLSNYFLLSSSFSWKIFHVFGRFKKLYNYTI